MQLARTGRWVYGGAEKLVDIVAFPFDFWYRVGRAAGALDHGETQVPLGPDGVLYYVRFTGAGDARMPTWVESSGRGTLEAAMAAAEERAPTPIVWNPPERSSGAVAATTSQGASPPLLILS
jgi:hypothetical protein